VTLDTVAVCATMPDVAAVLDALLAAGPQLGLQLVPRSGEVPSAPDPSWWVTCRADGTLPGADAAAVRLCAELVRAAGGLTWPR
jgi:hypothetical protein